MKELELQIDELKAELKEKREERDLWIAQKFRPPGDAEIKLAAANRLVGELQKGMERIAMAACLGGSPPESERRVLRILEITQEYTEKRNDEAVCAGCGYRPIDCACLPE